MPVKTIEGIKYVYILTNDVNIHKGDIIFYKKGNGVMAHATVMLPSSYDDMGRSFIVATDDEQAEAWRYKVIECNRVLFYMPEVLKKFLDLDFLRELCELLSKHYPEEATEL